MVKYIECYTQKSYNSKGTIRSLYFTLFSTIVFVVMTLHHFSTLEAAPNLHTYRSRVTDLILLVVLHRWSLMALSLHRSRCTSFMKSKCSASRTSPPLSQGPQVQRTRSHVHPLLHNQEEFSSCLCGSNAVSSGIMTENL